MLSHQPPQPTPKVSISRIKSLSAPICTRRSPHTELMQVTPGHQNVQKSTADQNKAAACVPKNTQMHMLEKHASAVAKGRRAARTPCARQLMPVIITHALIRFVLLLLLRGEREKENKREEGCPIDNVNRHRGPRV